MYLKCKNCGFTEEITKRLVLKVFAGDIVGGGLTAWVSRVVRTIVPLPLSVRIKCMLDHMTNPANANDIAEWFSEKHECRTCKHKNWEVAE